MTVTDGDGDGDGNGDGVVVARRGRHLAVVEAFGAGAGPEVGRLAATAVRGLR